MWPVLLAVAAGALLWWRLRDEDNALDSLPGPPRRPIIGCVFTFINANSRSLFVLVRQFAREYGDRYVVKIFKRRILHVFNPNDVEVILAHSKNITKSMPYTFLEPWLGTGLLLSTGSKWHKRRKILTPTFHFNILKNFTAVMEEKSRDLVGRLKATSGHEVDILPVISNFTLFTICETAMGVQLDSDKSAKTVAYKAAIMDVGNLLLSRLTNVWLHNNWMFGKSAVGKKFNNRLKILHEFADNVIEEKKQRRGENEEEFASYSAGGSADVGIKKRLAMLNLLLDAEDKGQIDRDGIREEVNTFMFEGHDTTAMAITFAIMLLADHEDTQTRIYEECCAIFGDSERTPSMADLAEMKYLDAVIKETLRLYPSVPFIARAITEDFNLGDLQVKAGTEVAVHIYDLHRRADLFPAPEQFRPERFLSGEVRHPYAYVPFSAGLRNCIGQRFAVLEMKCVLSEICRAFTLQPRARGARPDLMADMVLRPIHPIYIKFVPRFPSQ